MREFGVYLRAVVHNWIQFWSGALATVVGLGWQLAQTRDPALSLGVVKPWMLLVAGALVLFHAGFRAWRDEHERADDALRVLDKRRPKVVVDYRVGVDNAAGTNNSDPGFEFRNESKAVAVHVVPEIEGLPEDCTIYFPPEQIRHLRRGEPLKISPAVYYKYRQGDSSGHVPCGPAVRLLRTLAKGRHPNGTRLPHAMDSWVLRVTYVDLDGHETYESVYILRLISDLGDIEAMPASIAQIKQ